MVYQIKFPVLENETTIYIIFRKQQQFALSCVSVNFLKGNSLEWQHGDQTKACTKSKNAWYLLNSVHICLGFDPSNAIFTSPYKDFGGYQVEIVMPDYIQRTNKVYIYPDNSTVWTGSDFYAAQYLSEGLNFNLK